MTANFGPVMKGCLVLRVLWQQKKFKVKSHTTHQFGPENFPLKTSKATGKTLKKSNENQAIHAVTHRGTTPGWFGSELPGFHELIRGFACFLYFSSNKTYPP